MIMPKFVELEDFCVESMGLESLAFSVLSLVMNSSLKPTVHLAYVLSVQWYLFHQTTPTSLIKCFVALKVSANSTQRLQLSWSISSHMKYPKTTQVSPSHLCLLLEPALWKYQATQVKKCRRRYLPSLCKCLAILNYLPRFMTDYTLDEDEDEDYQTQHRYDGINDVFNTSLPWLKNTESVFGMGMLAQDQKKHFLDKVATELQRIRKLPPDTVVDRTYFELWDIGGQLAMRTQHIICVDTERSFFFLIFNASKDLDEKVTKEEFCHHGEKMELPPLF